MNRTALFVNNLLGLFVLLGPSADSLQAIVTSDELGSHATQPGVPSFGVNVDGVALVAGDVPSSESLADLIPVCTGALISDRHLLTAAHCCDEDEDGEVDFLFAFPHVAAFELAGDRTVMIGIDTATIQLPDVWPDWFADVAILTLQEEAPAEIPRYPLYGASHEIGRPFVVVGYGAAGHGSIGQVETYDEQPVKRAGRNRYDAIRDDMPGVEFLAYDFDNGQEAQNALRITGFESDLGFGDDEVLVGSGDSGGPVLIDGVIAGVTSFVARLPVADFTAGSDSSWGEVGFDTRVSRFIDFITEATGGQVTVVDRFPHEADFDGDGDVDGDDFLAWQVGFGTQAGAQKSDGDYDNDGEVDGDDFLGWQAEFGSGGSTSGATVPEPAPIVLLLVTASAVAWRRWRRCASQVPEFVST